MKVVEGGKGRGVFLYSRLEQNPQNRPTGSNINSHLLSFKHGYEPWHGLNWKIITHRWLRMIRVRSIPVIRKNEVAVC